MLGSMSGARIRQIAAAAMLMAGQAVAAVSGTMADPEVVHEYIPNVDPNEAALSVVGESGLAPPVIHDGKLVPPPGEAAPSTANRPMNAAPGDGRLQEEPGRRSPGFRPDRITAFRGRPTYDGTFNPSIAPFKRLTSLGGIALAEDGATPVLGIDDRRRIPVPVEGAQARPPDRRPRDRFWGDVTLDFGEGRTVPFPSVSPESRILMLRTQPEVKVRLERDGDGNFFAVAPRGSPASVVRVRFLTDAPRSYFGSPIPELSPAAYGGRVPPLDPSIRRRAERFAHEIGLSRGDDIRKIVRTLTRHFRSFEESASPPGNSGNIYLDLARGFKGVCRHRAYAFVITARALGIPARFVMNEAHAWVEVFVPGIRWMRIDLGGAAREIRTRAPGGRTPYRPAHHDLLPRPPQYQAARTAAARAARDGTGRGERDGAAAQAGRVGDYRRLVGRWIRLPAGQASETTGAPGDSVDEARDRKLRLSVDPKRVTVTRGKSLRVTGRVVDESGAAVGGIAVQILMRAPEGEAHLFLGVATSGPRGGFTGRYRVPADVPVGEYRLVALSMGDDRVEPAASR
jgi:hypothetical protein